MSLYISKPVVAIPPLGGAYVAGSVPVAYKRIRAAFRLSDVAVFTLDDIPRFQRAAFYAVSGECTKNAICAGGTSSIEMLLDCRAGPLLERPSPTYALAVESGLRGALPWSIGDQGGSEVAQALVWLQCFDQCLSAVICAGQKLSAVDQPKNPPFFSLAEGIASVVVSSTPIASGFEICGATLCYASNPLSALGTAIKGAIAQANESFDSIEWVIGHCVSDQYSDAIRQQLPSGVFRVRRTYEKFNFGSADTLISLSDLSEQFAPPEGPGIAIFAARFGTVGALVLKAL